MKRLLLPLLAALALPTAANAESIPEISDMKVDFTSHKRIDFDCPKKQKSNLRMGEKRRGISKNV